MRVARGGGEGDCEVNSRFSFTANKTVFSRFTKKQTNKKGRKGDLVDELYFEID